MLREHAFQPDVNALHTLLNRTREEIDAAENHTQLMLVEAKLTKALYKMVQSNRGVWRFHSRKTGRWYRYGQTASSIKGIIWLMDWQQWRRG